MWRDDGLLLDILIAARKIRRFADGVSIDQFVSNELLQLGVLHELQIIGEAASKVSRACKEVHTRVPWVGMVGLRHRLVHDYGQINLETIWAIVTEEIPALIGEIEPLVPPESGRS